jgi:hypothetical protein
VYYLPVPTSAIRLVALLMVISAIGVPAVIVVHRMMQKPVAQGPTAQMDVRVDGGITSIVVTDPSRNAAVDRAVSQLVKMVGSFGALPQTVRKRSEVLFIAATFRVERADLDRSILVVERYSTRT